MIRPLSSPVKDFIKKHITDDVSSLALQSHGSFDVPMAFIFDQIQAHQKAKTKLPSFAENFDLILPPPLSIEQASSEKTAELKADLVGSGKKILDLTGGMGIDAVYFAKKNKVTYIEQQKEVYDTAVFNFQQLNAANITAIHSEATLFLKDQPDKSFDIIYLDPARRDDSGGRVFGLTESEPNAIEIWSELKRVGYEVIIKASPMIDVEEVKRELPDITSATAVVVKNECKEILLATFPLSGADNCVAHLENNETDFFKWNVRMAASYELSMPLTYLYEPNVGIMKLKPFGAVGSIFNVAKLHRDSHLYTSDELISDFPGRIFKIDHTLKVDRKTLSKVLTNGKANLTVRNFPVSVENLRKKLKLKDGGDTYIFATTLKSGDKRLLICSKITS